MNYCAGPNEHCPDCNELDCVCPEENEDQNSGVWFKSAVSGMLYRDYRAAGDIDCIIVDGVWFERGEYAPIQGAF
jgi:hypothetical protein